MSKTVHAINEWHGGPESERQIIGESLQIKDVLKQAEIVGPTDSTVLLFGESGTGKELIAARIHKLSRRHDQAFVKVNCAAIPLGLLESELFGHERGAFTGAIAQRLGRFEMADGGTLLLDEVGDIPCELQPKLLRVLQDQEFERLGSARTIRTDVRLIAATHRNLAKMVNEGKFRADLYYRLKVFPITVPPLRERREDIPRLVCHFVRIFSRRMNRQIEIISPEVMDSLSRYAWTGNIRELENFIERAVILSRGPDLQPPLFELIPQSFDEPVTLRDAERAHIVRILGETGGVIASAAARLEIPRSTLFYKMRRLGIGSSRSRKPVKALGAASSM